MSGTTTITAASSINELPDDVQTLRQMVLTLLGQIDDLHGQLHYLKRQLFGRKSEKLDPNQRLLFENLYEEIQGKIEEQQQEQEKKRPPRKSSRRRHPGRKPLPAELPREEIIIEPDAAETTCSACGSTKEPIGREVTEKLDYRPASFFVKQYVRHKYACKQCAGEVAIGSLPAMAVDKGICGEGLLAHIITSKYCDHAPLNRLEGILKRHGVDLSVSTMCDQVGRCADLLAPLVNRMHQRVLASPTINTDDTGIPVKSPSRKGSTYTGYLWAYISAAREVVFDFTPTRSREGPLRMLQDYQGYVQADAYSGYDELFRRSEVTEVGCHAHARRKFEYALDTAPVKAAQMMALWSRLYEIERRAKQEGYDAARLLDTRQKEARPILTQMYALLEAHQKDALPKSSLGKAVTYALNQWGALLRYVDDPRLAIDNNLAERVLRMVVIGRKNYLFAGSEAGAKRAAIIYSLAATCKLHEVDPFAYFRDVLARVSTHPAGRIDELLPAPWKSLQNQTDDLAA